MSNDAPDTPDATPDHSSPVLSRLTRAQVFARDPEETTQEDIDFIVAELRKINERNRKARADDAAVAEDTAKLKKLNAAARKKKDSGKLAANLLDTKL
jgi:DNA-binding transcriptional regulator GbsR (MarR family)